MAGIYDYQLARDLAGDDLPVDALLFAAMRQADPTNETKLRVGWPELWAEHQARVEAPFGRLTEDGPTPTGAR